MTEHSLDMSAPVPIMVLSGFLGSGKTTLLTRMLEETKAAGLKPAVIMNEIGEISLDGAMVQAEVPMTEIMDGCICCSVRGELALAIKLLIEEHAPDIVIVEATGLANPVEIIESITDTSLIMNTELRSIVTVIGADHFFAMMGGSGAKKASRATLALLEDQVRVANRLILNKTDLLYPDQLFLVHEQIRLWNESAQVFQTSYAEISIDELIDRGAEAPNWEEEKVIAGDQGDDDTCLRHPHHDHVTVFTHKLSGPIKRSHFQRFIAELPAEVYRSKGLVTFEGKEEERQLFQYSYREVSLTKLLPRKSIPDVLVVMGEGISRTKLAQMMLQLEGNLPRTVRTGKIMRENLPHS
ncbi:CobW family GTP-binding protein [Gorillibacterium timonense]|uniref:CobW family GTP-binding protein n=1 Tax=Gorillibacterium timonense TaxID=1689269 RepID=UPI00071D33A0|nr:GTP-binding protein [Gorillibacterium timonense]